MVDEPLLEKIAGHEFDLNGFCRKANCDIKPQARMSDILNATKADLNKLGWAHSGSLNQTELDEITKKKDAIWLAVHKVSAL
jgi:hypothetical protein